MLNGFRVTLDMHITDVEVHSYHTAAAKQYLVTAACRLA